MTSTAVPPCPNTITGPKVGSSATPTMSSRAFGRTIIGKDGDAGDARVGLRRPRPGENFRGGLAHGVLAGEIEPHAADFRLVHDVGRLNLEDDRRAAGQVRPCRRDRFIGIARQRGRRDRDAIGRKQPGQLDRIEPGSLVAQHAVDDRPHRGDIRRKVLRQTGRRRHQQVARFAGSARDA